MLVSQEFGPNNSMSSVQGDYPLYNDTCYSLELNCKADIPQWGVEIMFCAETDVMFTQDQVYYLAGRQESFHLIK